jgi:DNA-binding transcriptional regulator YhcF (GntR family)
VSGQARPEASGEVAVRVVLDGPVPVYRQIADELRAHFVAGEMRPGQKLPTVRELAGSLGVHFNTVAEAYRLLAEEGWISLERRRGAAVLDRATPRPPKADAQARESNRLRQLIAELQSKGFAGEWIRREIEAALGGKL